jgi:predicted transcriptional regulator
MTPSDLSSFRKRFKLSKKAAANIFGCSPRAIYNYETGLRAIPKAIALSASAFAMGLPPYGEKMK